MEEILLNKLSVFVVLLSISSTVGSLGNSGNSLVLLATLSASSAVLAAKPAAASKIPNSIILSPFLPSREVARYSRLEEEYSELPVLLWGF